MKKLSSRILRKLEFGLGIHMQGSGFTVKSKENTDWGLLVMCRTDGSPHYRVTEYELQDSKSGAVINLMTKKEDRVGEIRKFVRAYNRARKAA